jgi:hypothetical protein
MIDIERLRVAAGLPVDDATRDAELELAYEQALTLCESYCDRWFPLQPQIEQIWPTRGAFMVKRYPIQSITAITDANGAQLAPATYLINAPAGIVLRYGAAIAASAWPLSIEYVGGYEPLPADLDYAVLAAFDAVWASTPGWGASSEASAGQMQKISVVGVGSIDFGTSSSSTSTESGQRFASDLKPWGVLPVTVTAALQRYLNYAVIGVG